MVLLDFFIAMGAVFRAVNVTRGVVTGHAPTVVTFVFYAPDDASKVVTRASGTNESAVVGDKKHFISTGPGEFLTNNFFNFTGFHSKILSR